MFGGRRAVSQPDTSQQRQVPDALSTLTAADSTRATPSSPLEPHLDAPLPTDTTPVAGAMAPSTATDGACDKRNSDASVGETAIDRTSQATTAAPSIRVMSADVEKDSQKVRLLYDSGDLTTWEGENRLSPLGEQNEPAVGQASEDVENDRSVSLARATPMRFPTDQVFLTASLSFSLQFGPPRDLQAPYRHGTMHHIDENTNLPAALRTGKTLTAPTSTGMASSARAGPSRALAHRPN
jgi:hypothetical protein